MGECSERIAASGAGSENNTRGSCKTHHVGISPQEDCGGTKGTVGQGEGCEEDCLVRKGNHNVILAISAYRDLTQFLLNPQPCRVA